ncbi:D-alanyl-D-alanine carboxypeptidase (penicillin-binding protein 5/6) [Kaistia soli DSM 19436]|uniref:serine-type D-Ala-D-Ala carboxypeptidase n=1 Tax=Kaistia soli DSM 19436 TaxID=1122133 RepID=A0A1M5FKG3_9HYPH|nr:D-alanyl-D-alanine carboxypeptidase family protein [Kaistia soli]SHF91975.1 D-alanyl-D-alanine carboxypeptidase (penicillin-binding protein 5/6) [Kaistia soli DSM 19436]
MLPYAPRQALIAVALLQLSVAAVQAQQAFDSKAPRAILIDVDSGATLYRKAENDPFEPAAMAKMMTMAVVFDALKAGEVKIDQTFKVSENAWRTGGAPSRGATMFAALKSGVPVADLLRGAIVQAGNDACLILAEGIAGSEAAFVVRMNEKAAALGLTGSSFRNVTGLADPEQKTTAADLATIANYLALTHPDLYKIYAEPDFTWNKIYQRNRNPLLAAGIGVDGLSTGYSETAGFGLTASALRDGHRLTAVVSGLPTDKARAEEASKLFDYADTAFERIRFFGAGETIADARVYGGVAGGVPLATTAPLDVLLVRGARDRIRARLVYDGPLVAPVKAGQQVGTVKVYVGDDLLVEKPVVTMADVATGTMERRAFDALGELLIGWL